MKLLALLLLTAVYSMSVWSCDLPFSVFQNGPNQIMLLLSKQAGGNTLTQEETTFMADFEKDQQQYWRLKTQSDPVCSIKPDIHNCISECKDRPKEIVNAAKYQENGFYYSSAPKERAELQKQARELEHKWEKFEYYKGY
jgi:hypothetical protein